MPRINCPKCGTLRVVMENKRRRCRKCGEWLTSRMGIDEKKVALQRELEDLQAKNLKKNGQPRANAKQENLDRITELEKLLPKNPDQEDQES